MIAEAVGVIGTQIAANLPTCSQMSRTINRVRNAGNPAKDPSKPDKFNLTPEMVKTAKGEDFLLFDNANENDRMLIFGTKENLRILKECTDLFCDGTFDVVPNLFSQLYTIHGMLFEPFQSFVIISTFAHTFQENTKDGISHGYMFWQQIKNKQHMKRFLRK